MNKIYLIWTEVFGIELVFNLEDLHYINKQFDWVNDYGTLYHDHDDVLWYVQL